MAIDRVKIKKEAEKYVQSGKIDRAIEEYRKLLEDNPKDLQLMNTIGDLCVQAGRLPDALDLFKRLAMSYERDGYAPKATAILKKAVRHAPEDMDLAQRLAELYRQTNMVKDAVAVHLQVAEHFTKKGLIKRALEEFTKVVELDPKKLKVKVRLADLYNKEGRRERAAVIYLEVAEALAIEQMHGEAAQIVERAKAMVATPQVFLTQSRLAVIQKDLQGAAQHLREGLQSNPRSTELLEALAEIEIQTKNPDRALEALVQMVQLPEKSLGLCERALRDMQRAGRTDEGLRIFKPIGRDFARRGMGDSVARTLRNSLQGNLTVEAWLQLVEIAHQTGNKHDQGHALQQAYTLAMQERDQTLAAEIERQMQALGLSPSVPSPSAPAAPPAPPTLSLEYTSPGTELTELDPVRRMQIQQLEREAENHLRTRSMDRAVEALKRVLELDPANMGTIERIAEIHRQSGVLSKVQMHYVNTAQHLAGLGKKMLAVQLLDKAEAMFPGSTRLHRRTLGLTAEDLAKETTPLKGVAAAATPEEPSGFAPIALPPPPEPEDATPPLAFDAIIPLDLPDFSAPPVPLPPVLAPPAPDPFLSLPPLELEVPGYTPPPPPLPPPPPAPETREMEFGLEDLGALEPPPVLEWEVGPSDKTASIPVPPLPVEELAPLEPPPALAAGPVVDEDLAALLSDIDFQLDYGSPEEAKVELDNALRQYPDHPELLQRMQMAEDALRKLGHEQKASGQPESDHSFFDLTDVLGDAFLDAGEGEEMHDATNVVEKVQSVDELFAAFREGVENQVRGDDYDTHYNLGIAYKEMMLMEPAMEEFKKAMDDPERTLECCSMLSICEMEQGNLEAAVDWLRQGIDAPGFPPEDSIGLRYDLGELFAQLGRPEEARVEFQAVYEIDSEYREVAAKLG